MYKWLIALLLIISLSALATRYEKQKPEAVDIPTTGAVIDILPPEVATTSPVESAQGVDIESNITARFSENVVLTSVNNAEFTLEQDGTPVSAQVSFDGETATLTPNSDLLPSTNYQATLGAGIVDTSNNALAEHSWSFYTDGKGWGAPAPIDSNTGDSYDPRIAQDTNGNTFAIWQQHDGTTTNIVTSYYTADTQRWSPSAPLELAAGGAEAPQIAVNANGDALAIWQQQSGAVSRIMTRSYSTENGWAFTRAMDTNASNALKPEVALNASGNAMMVWMQEDNAHEYHVMARLYTPASNIVGPVMQINSAGDTAFAPQVAIDATGNALAVWQQHDGTSTNIMANRYVAGSGWGTAAPIESSTGSAFSPKITMDSNNNALAVWRQHDGTHDSIMVNHYTDGSGWGSAESIESEDNGDAYKPQVAMDNNGNAFVAWQQGSSTSTNIMANHYSDGFWGEAELIESGAHNAHKPQVGISANGDAIAVWIQSDGAQFSIMSNRYTAGAWGIAALIESGTGATYSPQVTVNAEGGALSVWSQHNAERKSITANRFDPQSLVSPNGK